MNSPFFGALAIFILCALAFLGSIRVNHRKNKSYFRNNTALLFILPIAGLSLIMMAYFYSPEVKASSWGGPAEFGQFGDMIGGLLNPIFGFLTVYLLVQTLNIEKGNTESTNLKNQILLYESLINNRQKELEEIFKTEHMFDLPADFHDSHTHKPDTFFIQNVNAKDLKDSKRSTIRLQAEKNFISEQEDEDVRRPAYTNGYSLNNYNVVWRARKAIKDIRDIHIEIMNIANDDFYRSYQKNKFYEFVARNSSLGLIVTTELVTYTLQEDRFSTQAHPPTSPPPKSPD